MRNKFSRTGATGYRPLRKLRVIVAGLRCAVPHDLRVMYKAVLAVAVLGIAQRLGDGVDALPMLLASGLVVEIVRIWPRRTATLG